MSPLTSATTDSGAVASSGVTTTTTEAIIAAATSAEAAAAVAQEQGATLVTVHPAVIEAPVDVAEGQANEGEEVEGDGMCLDEYYRNFLRAQSTVYSLVLWMFSVNRSLVPTAWPEFSLNTAILMLFIRKHSV